MRRPTSASAFDSVYVMPYTKMSADQKAWDWYRANHKNLILFRDGAMGTSGITAPMIHFLPEFMKKNNFTSEDVRILSNGITSSTDAALIGNHQVVDRDITCKNGYIQKMDGVVEPFENMAQIVHEHANTSMWAYLLDRFSAPYYDKAKTRSTTGSTTPASTPCSPFVTSPPTHAEFACHLRQHQSGQCGQ